VEWSTGSTNASMISVAMLYKKTGDINFNVPVGIVGTSLND